MPGLGWSQAPAGRVGGHSCCGGLTVGEVSFGGAWPGHGYGMTKAVTTAASTWADWAWSSLDVMTTGVTSPSVMAAGTRARVFARSMSSWCVARSGPRLPGPGQQLAAHPVQLADMAPPSADSTSAITSYLLAHGKYTKFITRFRLVYQSNVV